MEAAKRTITDSIFSDMFGDKRNLIQFYQSLHPNDLYNNLDFRNVIG